MGSAVPPFQWASNDGNGYRVYQHAYSGMVHIVRGGGAVQTGAPTVVTNVASGVTVSGAQLSGSVAYSGSGSIAEHGFVYTMHPVRRGSGGCCWACLPWR